MTEAQQLWNDCSDSLRSQVSDATWRTWFSAIRPVTVANGTLVLAVPSATVHDRLEGRFHGLVHEALVDSSGKEVQFRFDVQVDESVLEDVARTRDDDRSATNGSGGDHRLANGSAPVVAPARGAGGHVEMRSGDDVPLNPKYTFDTFVIGPSNRFAHAAALSVAEAPARSYNPLFIYGAAGLGKTHLLQAVGNYVHENFPRMRVRYVSTETFMNEFVETLRAKDGMDVFRRRYRECDVLLIDDVQFMDKKESLQEELFHTFNSLYGSSKQIVLTSDRAPRAIATLEDRLRSRLLSGLTTDIQPPELETRIAILRTKAEHEHAVVGDDVLDFIATKVKDNIRELEGALIRVTAFASLNRQPLTRELAESVLADFVAADQPRADHRPADHRRRAPSTSASASTSSCGPEPAAAARDRPPDRHVPVPGADRLQLSGHRPRVRRPGPHDGDPRRREDLGPHEGAAPDLRPGHRAHRADQERWIICGHGVRVVEAGTTRALDRPQAPRDPGSCAVRSEDNRRSRARRLNRRKTGLSTIPRPYYSC